MVRGFANYCVWNSWHCQNLLSTSSSRVRLPFNNLHEAIEKAILHGPLSGFPDTKSTEVSAVPMSVSSSCGAGWSQTLEWSSKLWQQWLGYVFIHRTHADKKSTLLITERVTTESGFRKSQESGISPQKAEVQDAEQVGTHWCVSSPQSQECH